MSAPATLLKKLRGRLGRLPRSFLMFFATSLAARAVGIACQLLQVPFVVHTLGPEAFGLWMALTSVTALLQFADLGIGIGAQNRLAEHFARHELVEARALFGSACVLLVGGGLLFGLMLSGAVLLTNFTVLFHLTEAINIDRAPDAALIVVWMFCAGFPFGLAQRLAYARQEGWMHNIAQAAGSVGSLAVVAWGAHARWGLGGFVAGAQGAVLFGNIGLLGVQLARLRWLDPRGLACQAAHLRPLLRLGALFSLQQVLSTVIFALPQVVISTQLGAAAVTPYNLLRRLFNLFAVVQNAFLLPLWPAYAQAKARRQFIWMWRMLRHSIRATLLCCVVPMVAAAGFTPQVLRLWVGPAVEIPSWSLVWLLCAWSALVFVQQPFGYLLNGVSEVRRITAYCLLSAIASAVLMYWWAQPFGAAGVVAGLIAGYVPFIFIGNLAETRRYFRSTSATPAPPETVTLTAV
jgi:O-antigen/teichoic acid export membrane protein